MCAFSGLLGGHSMALMLKERGEHMQWYQDELLHMAKDLGLRLLPAFNTSSGLPYPRVRHNTQNTGVQPLNIGNKQTLKLQCCELECYAHRCHSFDAFHD